MPGRVVVIAGPSGSGKTERLLVDYRQALRAGPVGSVLWISPTHRSAAEIRQRLIDGELRACFRPAVMTFAQFAEMVLTASDRVVQPISDLMKRQILRRLIKIEARAGRLKYFGPIAETTGLVDLVTEFISELKRQEIWPEAFDEACAKSHLRRGKDQELVSLYRAYQQHLHDSQLYDAEGRFWTARDLLRLGQTRPFEHLRHVAVDGFTDFTRPQHEILETVAHRVDMLQISLPSESGRDRPELFAKSNGTRTEIQRRLPNVTVQTLDRPARPAWPALAHIEQELFKSPRLARRAEDATGIEVSEAGRAIDELYLVGRRIKQLLVQGDGTSRRAVSPGEVAVVMRSPSGLLPLLREAFDELGIPYALEDGYPLAQVPIAAALVAVLRLHVEDWPFRGLLHVLGNNYFRPTWEIARGSGIVEAADRTIRSLQVSRGRTAVLTALRRAADPSRGPTTAERARYHHEARQTLAILEQMAAAFARLPRRASAGEWLRALSTLAAELGLTRDVTRPRDGRPLDPDEQRDRQAWQLILEALAAVEKFTTAAGAAPDDFDAAEIFDLLADIVQTQQLRPETDETGRVRVLSATSARALSIPYLFFAGLSERAFPPPERSDRLYSEAEYARFAQAGLPLVLRAEVSQQEMLLFYEVITRAGRRLHLSYPGLDEKGQPLLPSPYLGELEDVCGGKVERFRIDDLRPIPRDGTVAGATDQRILAVAHAAKIDVCRAATGAGSTTPPSSKPSSARNDQTDMLAGLAANPATRPLFENILAGLAATSSRGERETFGPYEGILSPATHAALLARFGEKTRFSASRLEQYQGCPYRFFLSDVLKLQAVEEVGVTIDPLSRGSTLHDALARLHREVNQALRRAVSPALPAAKVAFDKAVTRLLADLARRAQDRAQPFQAALAEIERRELQQWLVQYVAQHAKYDKLWMELDEPLVPAHFEVSFGDEARSGDDPLSTTEPLVVEHGNRKVLVRGRIDRIDLGRMDDSPVLNVLDYKSGSARRYSLKAIESGDALQVFLYALAAEQLFAGEGRRPLAAGYWFIADKGYPEKHSLTMHESVDDTVRPTKDWQKVREQDKQLVIALVDRMREGQFPVFSCDEECTSYCDFRTVCRINQARVMEKVWPPVPPPPQD